jgi:hypothetical protein
MVEQTASKPRPIRGVEKQIADAAIWIMSRLNTWIFRASGGRLGNKFLRGAPVCLVTINLKANPDAEVEIGSDRRSVRARTASPAEKARLWPRLVEIYPDYADYQQRTTRDIPVVVLEPVG